MHFLLLKLKWILQILWKDIYTWSAEPVSQNNGDILITLKSTYAGEHIVTGKYFPLDKYKIIFTSGAPSANNSELEVSKIEAFAGE